MLVDLHVHSKRSPGSTLETREAIERAEALGLDGICIVDRDSLEGAEELRSLRAEAKIAIFSGMLASTDHGNFLCFFPDPSRVEVDRILGTGPASSRCAREVVTAVLAQGGAVIASAPYDRELEKPMGDYLLTLRELTAVEGFMGTQRANVNELAIEAASHLALPCVGGSGALKDYEEIGTAATLFREEFRDEAGLVAALKGGVIWPVAIGTPPRFHGDEVVMRAPRESGVPGDDRRDGRRDGRRGGGSRRRGGGHRRPKER